MKLLLVLAVVAYVSCTSYAGPRPKRHADEDRVQYSLNYDSDYGYDVDYSFGAESEGQEESESEEKDVPKEKKEKGGALNCPAKEAFERTFRSTAPGCFGNKTCKPNCRLSAGNHKPCHHENVWTHHGSSTGPNCWRKVYKHCSGYRQSPINIVTTQTQMHPEMGDLCLQTTGKNLRVSMHNTGHDVQAKLDAASSKSTTVSGGPLGSGVFRVVQFHFHFSSDKSQGSEHQIDGSGSAAEMHIVMQNVKYESFSQAAGRCDGLAVIAVLLGQDYRRYLTGNANGDTSYQSQQVFGDIFDKAACKTTCAQKEQPYSSTFKLQHLLPSDYRREYFSYKGSLTTPPCSESVTWIVMRSGFYVCNASLRAFAAVSTSSSGQKFTPMAGNRRPVQPMNGRTVHTAGGKEKCSNRA